MKVYEEKEVCDIFTKYVRVNFDTATEAAIHYGVTNAFISNIKRDLAAPNEKMLADIGFKRKNGFVKSKR